MLSRALANLPWLESVYQMTVNNPDFWRVEQAAALGVGNARSLAKIFSLVSTVDKMRYRLIDYSWERRRLYLRRLSIYWKYLIIKIWI